MTPLSPNEYTFIKVGIDNLADPQGPWCPHFIQGKMNNDERASGKSVTSSEQISKIVLSLIKKQYVFTVWTDRYRFNWTAVQSIQ